VIGMFRSLRNRNYRLFFTGSAISNVGTWLQRIAQDWLVLQLGGGGIALGQARREAAGDRAGLERRIVEKFANQRLQGRPLRQFANQPLKYAAGLLEADDTARSENYPPNSVLAALLDTLDQIALPCQAMQLPDTEADEHCKARQRGNDDRR
jgi:hypothetical protein